MQQLWSAEELVEHWSLTPEELALLPGKVDGGKLGFAVQLVFYRQHAKFPDDEADVAPTVIAHIAGQIGVPTATLDGYDWTGRTGRRHRQLILDFLAVAPLLMAAGIRVNLATFTLRLRAFHHPRSDCGWAASPYQG